MSDFFDNDNVVKEYDSTLVKRILAYIKPHKVLLFLTFLALTVSTAGELLLPVLEQQLIDNSILAKYLVIDLTTSAIYSDTSELSEQSKRELEKLKTAKDAVTANGLIFIPRNQNLRMPASVEKELSAKKISLDEQWYVFSYTQEVQQKIGNISTIIISDDKEHAVIKTNDLNKLSKDKIALIRNDDLRNIVRVVLFLFFSLIFVFAATFVQTWAANLIGQFVMKAIRMDMFKKTIFQSTGFLSRHPVGRMVTRLTSDVETINEFFTSFMVALIKDIVLMAGVLLTLFFLSPHLALVVIVLLPPVAVLTVVTRVRAREAFRRQRTASSTVTAYLSERLSGLQVVQIFVREKLSKKEFSVRNKELLDSNLSEIRVFATFRPVVEFFATLTTASLLVVGSVLVFNLTLSLGVLIAFLNLVVMFYAPILDISEKYTILQSAMAGAERVFALLDTNESIPNTGTAILAQPVKGNIEFNDVHFSYKKGEEILKGLNFSVADGKAAAIVGYTGAGKSTIINVLSRLWDIDSGTIKLNGMNIKDLPLGVLRATILPVLQDVFLFSGTVAENISMGINISEQEIIDAAKAVNAHDFIVKLPQGYQTVLSEGATNISAGQRQLLSFARVLAHNPAIVVLDEATSSIDTETERLVQEGISRVLAGRTSIVIAHRLSTICNSDTILVLRGGMLTEQGTHDELIAKDGLYAGLYRLQFAG
ncbi:MAG: ABC transporter ATP-binding protein [Termitinemataceae bacterium]|nr:MAG: ABC transporter ATP-binding protein [Termitinemataceae bacterium]